MSEAHVIEYLPLAALKPDPRNPRTHSKKQVQQIAESIHFNAVELGRHGRYRCNVFDHASVNSFVGSRREDLALHPTVKPTALVADVIKDVTRRDDIVLDGFRGSGTLLLACELTGRRARGLEIDPAYVDVALERWIAMTGKQPILQATGETYEQRRAAMGASYGEEHPVDAA